MSDVHAVVEKIVLDPNGSIIAISGRYDYRHEELVDSSPFEAFAKGAYSFPRDWWVAIHWSNGMRGLYGQKKKQQAERIGRDLMMMFRLARAGAPYVARVTYAVLSYILKNELTGIVKIDEALKRIDKRAFLHGTVNQAAGTAGRFSGGIFTSYAASGGRGGKRAVPKPSKVRKIGKYSNTVLASFGALILLSARTRGVTDSVSMMMAVFNGSSGPKLNHDIYKALFQAVQRSGYKIDQNEDRAYHNLINLMQTITSDVEADARIR